MIYRSRLCWLGFVGFLLCGEKLQAVNWYSTVTCSVSFFGNQQAPSIRAFSPSSHQTSRQTNHSACDGMIFQLSKRFIRFFSPSRGSSTRSEDSRETSRERGVRLLSPEEPPERNFCDPRAEHAECCDEASRLRKEHDRFQMQLHAISRDFTRQITELRNHDTSLTAEVEELQKSRKSVGENLARSQAENTILKNAITKFQNLENDLKRRIRESSTQNEIIRRESGKWHSMAIQLQRDLREIQEREYAAIKQPDIESHEAVSAQFGNLFRRCDSWARRYFKLGVEDFRVEEFPTFAQELELVSWSDTNWGGKKFFRVNHLVQAVLGNILVRKVFKCPFAGCSEDFCREFRGLYEAKLRVEGEQAAHRWRASSLTTYYQCENWPPGEGPPIGTYRASHLKAVEGLILEALSPITSTHFGDRTAEERSSQGVQLLEIIGEAIDLAAKMSQQASNLVVIDKEWFQKNGRELGRDDDRVKDRLGDGDYNPGTDLTVDFILSPGFLKRGNDDAEYLDRYNVWMPANVDIRDRQGRSPPPASTGASKQGSRAGDGQDFTLVPPVPLEFCTPGGLLAVRGEKMNLPCGTEADRQGGSPPPVSGQAPANERVELGDGQDFTLGPPTDLSGDRLGDGESLGEEAYGSDETL